MDGRNWWLRSLAAGFGVLVIGAAAWAGSADTLTDGIGAPAGGPPSAQTVADIYIVALTGDAAPVHLENPIYVYDRVCPGVPEGPGAGCDGDPIPMAVQDGVTEALGTQVHFLADPPAPPQQGGPAVYDIGELTVTGAHATLGIQGICGALCGSGEVLTLARTDGTWRITHRETRWIS